MELGDTLRPYGKAWKAKGGVVDANFRANWRFCSMTQDPKGREEKEVLEAVCANWPEGVLLDAPQGCRRKNLTDSLNKHKYERHEVQQECSRLGDATTRTRRFVVVLESSGGSGQRLWELPMLGEKRQAAQKAS